MDDVGRYLWSLLIAVILLFIAVFFSMVKTAVGTLTESRLKKLAETSEKKAQFLYSIKIKEHRFFMWTKAAALLCGTASVCVFARTIAELLYKTNLNSTAADIIGYFTAAYIVVIFGFLLPSRLSGYKAESVALHSCFALKLLKPICTLFTIIPTAVTGLFLRACGHNPDDAGDYITEDEIRLMIEAGNESGTIEKDEREMINNVFDFGERTVEEVMTHRTDIEAVSLEHDKLADVLKLAIEEGYSRIPVYGDDMDDIVGIVYAKDLLKLVGKKDISNEELESYLHEPIFVPESARCGTLFKQLKSNKTHMAVVVDEYGGTAGIATMEDLLESIVGNIQDEYDSEEEEITLLKDGSYSLDGGIQLKKVEELFGAELEPDDDTDTLGGLITNTLGRIPMEGETPSIEVSGIEFKVMKTEDRRIQRVLARVPEAAKEEE